MNIYDVAREAGVSIATISRVVNGKARVSKRTKENVEAVLKKHNYTPNAMARGLVVKSMKTVGVLSIDIRDIYYANTAYIIEQELSLPGYNVMLCNTGGDTDKKSRYIRMLAEKNVDGMILVGSVFKDEGIEKMICNVAEKIPVVMVNGFIDGENIYSILCDDAYGTAVCVDYLYGRGHRDIVYFQDTDTYSAKAKVKGFEEGMLKNGLEIKPYSVLKVEKGLQGGADGVQQLLMGNYGFSAIVTGEDIIAAGAIKKLTESGLNVPGDIAVAGFNNSVIAQCCTPELTSVDSKMEMMGANAVRILSDVMEGRNVPSKMIITPSLVVRKST